MGGEHSKFLKDYRDEEKEAGNSSKKLFEIGEKLPTKNIRVGMSNKTMSNSAKDCYNYYNNSLMLFKS